MARIYLLGFVVGSLARVGRENPIQLFVIQALLLRIYGIRIENGMLLSSIVFLTIILMWKVV